MPHRSQGVGTALVDGDAGPRPRHVPDVLIGAVVAEVPQAMARLPIEAVDPFRRAWLGLPVGDIDAAVGHGRPAVSAADAGPPANGKLGGRELFDNAGFPPHAIAGRATPLRPIVAHQGTTAHGQADGHAERENNATCFIHAAGKPATGKRQGEKPRKPFPCEGGVSLARMLLIVVARMGRSRGRSFRGRYGPPVQLVAS